MTDAEGAERGTVWLSDITAEILLYSSMEISPFAKRSVSGDREKVRPCSSGRTSLSGTSRSSVSR